MDNETLDKLIEIMSDEGLLGGDSDDYLEPERLWILSTVMKIMDFMVSTGLYSKN